MPCIGVLSTFAQRVVMLLPAHSLHRGEESYRTAEGLLLARAEAGRLEVGHVRKPSRHHVATRSSQSCAHQWPDWVDEMTSVASRYQGAFGLSDNPFNPSRFKDVRGRLLDELSSWPLRLDEAPALRALYVEEAGFSDSLLKYENLLKSRGYIRDSGTEHELKSIFIRIIGNSGTGKSTLAYEMVRQLKHHQAPNQLFEAKVSDSLDTPETVITEFADLREKARRAGAMPRCIILDDIPASCLSSVEKLYVELTHEQPTVLLLIMSDIDALRQALPTSRMSPRDFRTTNLSANQAVAFVRKRFSLFRIPSIHDHLANLSLNFYPFDDEEIVRVAMPADGDPDTPGSIPLRLLNQSLDFSLEETVIRMSGQHSLLELSAEDLKKRLVSLQQFYNRRLEQLLAA
jgi:ATPase family associated with various cellular activities (AAA)